MIDPTIPLLGNPDAQLRPVIRRCAQNLHAQPAAFAGKRFLESAVEKRMDRFELIVGDGHAYERVDLAMLMDEPLPDSLEASAPTRGL